jgi:predicted DNA binding CopG/RHH family protein
VFREDTVKVTIALSKASVEFFKQEATKHKVSYQRLIRRLLDEYTHYHAG